MNRNQPAPDTDERPSKTQLKREMLELQELGESLLDMTDRDLAKLALPDRLLTAINDAKQMTKRGALYRQKQYIGKVMRTIDPTVIRDALAQREAAARMDAARLHVIENWRERLIRDGDTALEQLVNEQPTTDRQHIRQLIRKAADEAKRGAAPRAARQLFRYISELMR